MEYPIGVPADRSTTLPALSIQWRTDIAQGSMHPNFVNAAAPVSPTGPGVPTHYTVTMPPDKYASAFVGHRLTEPNMVRDFDLHPSSHDQAMMAQAQTYHAMHRPGAGPGPTMRRPSTAPSRRYHPVRSRCAHNGGVPPCQACRRVALGHANGAPAQNHVAIPEDAIQEDVTKDYSAFLHYVSGRELPNARHN